MAIFYKFYPNRIDVFMWYTPVREYENNRKINFKLDNVGAAIHYIILRWVKYKSIFEKSFVEMITNLIFGKSFINMQKSSETRIHLQIPAA